MMREGVGLIDVPKAGRRVIDYYHLPSEQTAWAAPYRGREGKLCSRKNTSHRVGVFRRQTPTIIRVLQRKLYREAKDELTLRDDACGQ